MKHLGSHLRAHGRLAMAMLTGAAATLALPDSHALVTRALLGWNVAVWLYLVILGAVMLRADHHRVRRVAEAQAESAGVVLVIVTVASIVSLVGIVLELSIAKAQGSSHALPHIALALATVAGSWLLLPSMFGLTYASVYYDDEPACGLKFPGSEAGFKPAYDDFMYFAFTIAVASQTSDVSVTTRAMRRLVLFQSVLSFAFNTAILAFTVNLAASMF